MLTEGQIRYRKYKVSYAAYRSNHRDYMREYRQKNRDLIRSQVKVRLDKIRNGGLRESVFKRDGFCCQLCGMTNEEHKQEFGRNLTIHHKDHSGRNNLENGKPSNNEINNMTTLCLRCHGRIDRLYQLGISL